MAEEDMSPDEDLIRISQMEITNVEEAKIIAEEIILILEEDLMEVFEERTGRPLSYEPIVEVEETVREKISGSSISVSSKTSIPLEGEPSKLRLFYSKGENATKNQPLPHIHGQGVDEEIQITLHRSRKWKKGEKPTFAEGFTQTKAMTMVPDSKAQFVFMELYPKPDDYKVPEVPTRYLITL